MNLDFSEIKVLLIGDLMLDHYIIGKSQRMSPEAPVPIVVSEKEFSVPGGAGNVAMNLSSMGAKITCCGVVGNDLAGSTLIEILSDNKINIENIEIINNHLTTLKTRIYSDGLQVGRFDKEAFLSKNSSFMNINYEDYDCIILSDYNKGLLNEKWFLKPNTIDVILDPKKKSKHLFENSNIITPNLIELENISGFKISDNDSILDASNFLIKNYNFDYVVAKMGDKGIKIVGKDNFSKDIEGHLVENPDVTGAGDTVISALSIAYAKTKDIEISAKIANAAASIVVGKMGTAVGDINEIKKLL